MNEPAGKLAASAVPAEGHPNGERPLSLSDRVRTLRLPERSSVPARPSWLPWALCGFFALAAAFFAFKNWDNARLAAKVDELTKSSPVNLGAAPGATSSADPNEIALESKGYIIPISLILVSPLVGGRVKDLSIWEGKRVKEGDVLAELETEDYQPERDRAKAVHEASRRRHNELTKYRDKEIQQVKAELEDSAAQRDQLYLEYQRNIDLKNRGSVAKRDFEQAHSSFLSMDKRVERLKLAYDLMVEGPRDEKIAVLKAEIDQAKADLDKSEWRLSNCTIRAPTHGIILSKKAERGNMVNPSAFSNGLSASLCEMADLTRMEVDLAVAERDISRIFEHQECHVRAEAFPDRNYLGYVSRIMPQADRGKGAVPVRVRIGGISRGDEGKFLRPEMGAIVVFFNKKMPQEEIRNIEK